MIKNGKVRRDIAPGQYHRWPENEGVDRGDPRRCLSRSELVQMLDCGEMFLAGGRQTESSSLSFGSLVDCLLLTPDLFDKHYIVAPATYESGGEEKKWTKAAAICKGWHAENPGKPPPKTYKTKVISKAWTKQSNTCTAWEEEQRRKGLQVVYQKDLDKANQCANAVREKTIRGVRLGDLIDESETQLCFTAEWHCPETGLIVPVRVLPDMVRGSLIYDLKTSQEVKKWKFERSIRDYYYDVQAWMYSEVIASAMNLESMPFGFIAVRNTKPFLVATYKAERATLANGRERFEKAMSDYTAALVSGDFKGYTTNFDAI